MINNIAPVTYGQRQNDLLNNSDFIASLNMSNEKVKQLFRENLF